MQAGMYINYYPYTHPVYYVIEVPLQFLNNKTGNYSHRKREKGYYYICRKPQLNVLK